MIWAYGEDVLSSTSCEVHGVAMRISMADDACLAVCDIFCRGSKRAEVLLRLLALGGILG